MTPDLARFFASMDRYFAAPGEERLAALVAEHGGWEVDPRRVAIYGRAARGNLRSVLEKLYPGCRDLLTPEAWEALVEAHYASRPAGRFELNAAGAGFPALLEDRPDLPACAAAVARLEWAVFQTYAQGPDLPREPAELQVNPSLVTLEHPWRLCAWLRPPRSGAPEPGDEVALVWRHPGSLRARYKAATSRDLLALKLVLEAIPPARAAAEGGVAVDEIEAALDDAVTRGLVLRPS